MSSSANGEWPRPQSWRQVLLAALLIALTALVYQPVRYAGFLWDDDAHLTANPTITGPLGFRDIWTPRSADIAPLTRSTFWLGHALWGFAPLPYHLLTVVLHAGCAVLLWLLLRRLRIPGAWVGAALWALHPLQVESVAWVAEMKNTESGLFFLLSILCYLLFLKQWRKPLSYSAMLLFAFAAMAAKSSTVILPLILLLCAWWTEGPWDRKVLARRIGSLVPVFLLSLLTSVQSVWSTHALMQTDADPQPWRTYPERLIAAGNAFWFYLGKLLWPHPQMTIYPRWDIAATYWIEYLPLLGAMAVMGILWLRRNSAYRPLFAAMAWFAIALLPVSGLVDHYELRYALVFDHFQYLAGMGPLALAGAALVLAPDRIRGFTASGRKWLRVLLCGLVLSAAGARSWQRTWVFQNEETLWTDALAKNPESWAGHNNLGNFYFAQGRVDEAVNQYQTALEIHPGYLKALANLGLALSAQGRLNESLAYLREALSIGPSFAIARNSLGLTLAKLKRYDEAIAEFRTALRLDPGYANARNNLVRTEAQAAAAHQGGE